MKMTIKQSLALFSLAASLLLITAATPAPRVSVPASPETQVLPVAALQPIQHAQSAPWVSFWLDKIFYDSYRYQETYWEWHQHVVRYYAPLPYNVKVRFRVYGEHYYTGNPFPYSTTNNYYEETSNAGATSTDLGIWQTIDEDVYLTSYYWIYVDGIDPI